MDTHFTVRYAETDQMGIVHHSNYPIWLVVSLRFTARYAS